MTRNSEVPSGGLAPRLAAYVVDSWVSAIATGGVVSSAWLARGTAPSGFFLLCLAAGGLLLGGLFLVVYEACSWTKWQQTLGMRLFRVALTSVDGNPMTASRALARALPSGIPYVSASVVVFVIAVRPDAGDAASLGGLCANIVWAASVLPILWRPHLTVADRLAGTMVVKRASHAT